MLFFIFVCIVCTDDEHLPPDGLHTRRGADPNLSSTLWWSPCYFCLITFFGVHLTVMLCSVCSLWYHLCWSSVPGDMMTLKHGVHRGIYGLWIEDPEFSSLLVWSTLCGVYARYLLCISGYLFLFGCMQCTIIVVY